MIFVGLKFRSFFDDDLWDWETELSLMSSFSLDENWLLD